MRTASRARSRLPLLVVAFGAAIRFSACSRVSHRPVRIPVRLTPLTREIALAVLGGMNPLSAASMASLRMADRRWLMVEDDNFRPSRLDAVGVHLRLPPRLTQTVKTQLTVR